MTGPCHSVSPLGSRDDENRGHSHTRFQTSLPVRWAAARGCSPRLTRHSSTQRPSLRHLGLHRGVPGWFGMCDYWELWASSFFAGFTFNSEFRQSKRGIGRTGSETASVWNWGFPTRRPGEKPCQVISHTGQQSWAPTPGPASAVLSHRTLKPITVVTEPEWGPGYPWGRCPAIH